MTKRGIKILRKLMDRMETQGVKDPHIRLVNPGTKEKNLLERITNLLYSAKNNDAFFFMCSNLEHFRAICAIVKATLPNDYPPTFTRLENKPGRVFAACGLCLVHSKTDVTLTRRGIEILRKLMDRMGAQGVKDPHIRLVNLGTKEKNLPDKVVSILRLAENDDAFFFMCGDVEDFQAIYDTVKSVLPPDYG